MKITPSPETGIKVFPASETPYYCFGVKGTALSLGPISTTGSVRTGQAAEAYTTWAEVLASLTGHGFDVSKMIDPAA